MEKDDKFFWVILLSIFLVPLSGAFSSMTWKMQSDVLYVFLAILASLGISKFTEKQCWWVLRAIVGLVVIQGIWVILQTLGIDPLFSSKTNPALDLPFGFSGSPNQSGLFFGVTLPLVASVFPIALPFSLYGLLCAKTTSVFIGVIISIITLCSFLYRKALKYIFVTLFVISILFFARFENINSSMISERYELYKYSTIAAWKGNIPLPQNGKIYIGICNPWFGFGFGNFERLSPINQDLYVKAAHRYRHAHNDYIEMFFEFGRVGLGVVLIFLINFFWGFVRAAKTKLLVITFCCVLTQLISALGIFTIHTATSGMLLVIFYGLYLSELRRSK